MGAHMNGKASGATRHGDKGLLGVAKKLALTGTGTGSGTGESWDDMPVGGNAKATGQGLGPGLGLGKAMPMIKEEVEGGDGNASEELNSALTAGWLRTMNLGNLDANVATTDPEETERLVTFATYVFIILPLVTYLFNLYLLNIHNALFDYTLFDNTSSHATLSLNTPSFYR